VRCAGLLSFGLVLMVARGAEADCAPPSGCVDAEPLWLSPSAGAFATISEPKAADRGALAAAATLGFRYRPAVLNVPAPNRDGRDVNVLRHATDLSLAARFGLGNRLELTLLLPAGLYQRGAGIKGITEQAAPAIPVASLHDPRVGFGFGLAERGAFGAKLRFEAKLPLGSRESSGGENSLVASPSLALAARSSGFFAGAELGLRLRRPAELFGTRVGSQASLAAGVGYALARGRVQLSVEAYVLPSLVDAGDRRYLPAEWLGSLRWAPGKSWAFALRGGSALPLSGDGGGSSVAYGVPAFRALVFASFEQR
jgi:hypothetical protein